MQDRILELCRELCGKELSIDEQLIVSGLLDSYKIMELICGLEKEFEITFLPEEISNLENFSCIISIMKIVNKKIGTSFDAE